MRSKLVQSAAVAAIVFALLGGGFVGGVFYSRAVAEPATVLSNADGLDAAVNEVANIIDLEALKPSSEASLTAGAISGMLGSLEDSHAAYFDAAHYKYFTDQTNGSFYGIGVTIGNEGDALVIVSVLEGTPAEKGGLKANDIIVTINGEKRARWDVDEAVLRIRGEQGTKVTLGVLRDGATQPQEFQITRAKIDLPNIETELLDGGVGYIRLYGFTDPAAQEVRDAIAELAGTGAKGFILDLRDNPGGLLDASVAVSSAFIEDGVIVKVQGRTGTMEQHRASGEVATTAPLVVLINGNSASASEITAGALQDYARATLVGEQSYGKGSVQQIEPLTFGGAVKLTIAHYLTPKDRVIDKVGLTPDVVVPMAPELQADKATDTQLQKALEVLRGKL